MRLLYFSVSHLSKKNYTSDERVCILIFFSPCAAACCVWGKQHSSPFSALGGGHEPLASRSQPVPYCLLSWEERAGRQAGRIAGFLVHWLDGWLLHSDGQRCQKSGHEKACRGLRITDDTKQIQKKKERERETTNLDAIVSFRFCVKCKAAYINKTEWRVSSGSNDSWIWAPQINPRCKDGLKAVIYALKIAVSFVSAP